VLACASDCRSSRDTDVEVDITCKSLIAELDAFLDGALGALEESRCRLHLDACADCAKYLRDYRSTIELSRDATRRPLDAPEPPGGARDPSALPDSLLEAILASRRRH
jgi:anti-sigma factor RsiW